MTKNNFPPQPEEAMESLLGPAAVNERIKLYEGPITLRAEDGVMSGEGWVAYDFVPEPAIRFEVNSSELSSAKLVTANEEAPTRLEVGTQTTSASVMVFHFEQSFSRGNESQSASGVLTEPMTTETGESPGYVQFHLANFHGYVGEVIADSSNGVDWPGRVVFEFDKWRITLDTMADIRERQRQAMAEGGYAVTHVGKLERRDGKFCYLQQIEHALEFLYWFFSFVNGARCDCILPTGIQNPRHRVWEKWSAMKVAPAEHNGTWFSEHLPEEGMKSAEGLYKLWRHPSNRDWLTFAMSIYLVSNRNATGVDLSLVNAQIALELLSWVILVEQNSWASEDGFEKLPAADKIRMLLLWCGVTTIIPDTLVELLADVRKEFKSGKLLDGPFVITELRNSLVHPNKPKRDKRHALSGKGWWQAWQLSMWYIDLILLKLIDYSGPYNNRLGNAPGHFFELVPWAVSNSFKGISPVVPESP